MKGIKIFIIGILLCVAVYIGVFIGRNSMTDSIQLKNIPYQEDSEKISLLNLNTATLDELCTLPGVGPKLSKEIIRYREKYGDFVHIKELMDIDGISSELYEQIRPYITVD